MAEIFLMEDSPPLRRLLIGQIREGGHNVTAFENGHESRDPELMKQADLLVTDLKMPEVDGADVIRNASSLYPNLPIIIITGESSESVADLQVVRRVLKKPFTAEKLLAAIDTVLEENMIIKSDSDES